ncbi:MAG TPA: thioredoxin family protein [Bacteroidetes bacterium]|nr:thioredoxin family protein [Bacteroidota bacterium]
MSIFTKKYIQDSLSYEEYRQMGKDLVQQGKTTGPNQTEKLFGYSKLNDKRMDRLDKTQELQPETIEFIKSIRMPQYWVMITELWCGDAAIHLPLIEKMAALNPRIRLCILLRDDNPEIIDEYLTEGTRSIPKLILLDENLEEIGVWGPRPEGAQQIRDEWKAAGGGDKEVMLEAIQRWYIQDKGISVQREVLALLTKKQETAT